MRVNRIDHINIRTPLLEETLSFYERLLDLKRGRAAGMDQARNAWLYDQDEQPIVHVNMPDEGELLPGDADTGRVHHVALDCVGHDEFMGRVRQMDVPHSLNLIDEIGLRQVFIMDPNGVRLELNFRAGN